MKFTLSTAITLLTCAIGSVSASLSEGSALGSRDVSPEDVAAAYEAGLPDPRVSKRSLQKRFDPNTQTLSKIGIFDSNTGASNGFLYVFGDIMRNTTTQPSQFQYVTAAARSGQPFDIEFPEQGGVFTKQFTIASKVSATSGLNSPTVNPNVKSDLNGAAYPLRSPAGATPTYDAIHETWFETAVWTAAADGTLTCTWINPDGTPIQLFPYLIIEALHFSPNPALLYPWGGPWFDIKTVTLKLVN